MAVRIGVSVPEIILWANKFVEGKLTASFEHQFRPKLYLDRFALDSWDVVQWVGANCTGHIKSSADFFYFESVDDALLCFLHFHVD